MKGCITKKGSTYSVVVEVGHDSKGKRKQKWYNGYKTRKAAEKELIEILHQLETNTYIVPEKITLAEYLNQWMKDYAEVNLAPKTIEGYRVNIEGHIIPKIGDIYLQKLQPVHIQKFYSEKLKNGRLDGEGGLSPRSVLYIHRVLREALNHAVKMQLIPRNVADAVEIPKQKVYRAAFLDEKQVLQLLEAVKDYNLIYIPVLLAVSLGLRRGEALGLRWNDIDFENKTVTISRSLLPSKKGLIFHDPKTDTSSRTIVMPDFVIEELKIHQQKQEEHKRILEKAYNSYDLICCYEDGLPINPANFSHLFNKMLIKNELPVIRYHDLRHTNASLMLKCGIPAKVASERLGHANIGITLDLYSHVMREMQIDAANRINLLLNGKK